MAALPSTIPQPPAMLGADNEARQEYFAALQKTLDALEARAQPKPNWFELAGAFLEPGRTGGFGEAVGRAASTLGAQQQRQREMELPIAQMRAQIAGQKYETENQAKALQMLSATLGVAPAQAQDVLQGGLLPTNVTAKLAQTYPTIAQLSPKVGEIVKGAFTMQAELKKLADEDRKAGMSQAELVAKYGAGVLSLIPGGGIPMAPAAGVSAPLPEASTQVPAAPTEPTPAVTRPTTAPAQRPASAVDPELAGLPLATQAETAQKRIVEGDKPYFARRDEILNFTPQLVQSSITNLKQLDTIARQYPQIFALMQEQGLLSGLFTAAQEGAQATVGDANVRLGLPVRQFLEKVKLKPEEQQKVRDVARILGTEFLNNVKANRGLLGVNPTDNDARLLQAPMASIEDSAKAVQYWSRNQILLNKQREELYNAFDAYSTRVGPTASPRRFFSPGSEYERINKSYAAYRERLFRQFNPEPQQ